MSWRGREVSGGSQVKLDTSAPPAPPSRIPPTLESAAAAMGIPPAMLEQQLLQLTPEQLMALPAEQQAQVLELQQLLRG